MSLVTRQLPLFVFMALLGAMAWFSLTRVQFSASLYELLPQDLPEVRGMDWLNRYFSRDGQLIVTVSSPDPGVTRETSRLLVEKLRHSPDLISIVHEEMALDRIAMEGGGMLAWLWLNADPQEVEKLSDRLSGESSAQTVAESMEIITEGFFDGETIIRSYDPLALSRLPDSLREMDASEADAMTSPDGKFRLFYVEGSGVDFSDYRAAAVWLDQMKELVAGWKRENDIPQSTRIGLTGTPAFMAEVGTEMERDMTLSVMATMALISLLFWIMHRQSRPLGWLIATLFFILILTVNLGGLLFGNLSVMSAGFAAILLGLAVDYGIVLYREAMNGAKTSAELRRKVGPAILWAATTTSVVFLSLNFSSLPGIAEMGNLVAIGIAIGAGMMIWGFSEIAVSFAAGARHNRKAEAKPVPARTRIAIIATLAIPILAGISIFVKEIPHLEAQFHPFRIRSSPSMKAWQEMQSSLRGRENSIPVVITGDSIGELQERTADLGRKLEEARLNGDIERFMLPPGILPDPTHQKRNVEELEKVVSEKERLLKEIDEAGFSDEGKTLTREVLETWEVAIHDIDKGEPFAMPRGDFAEWTVGRLFYRGDDGFAALGSVKPSNPGERAWIVATFDQHTAIASLGALGTALNERIGKDIRTVFLPMILVLTLMLFIVFRSWKDWLIAVFSLIFSGCALVALTLWTPLSWNSFNICGLPLLFGTGLDFGIHMIFALRRSGGDLHVVKNGISKALLFCGTSSAIGFGSLAFASAHGLASLGQICAAGLLINMVVAVWLLPRWYRMIHRI
ncbi:MAG: MMPL family transporter [Verrucomicrobiales bacterium]|nr:MMPL family transporter [Verrucomicrobiales bacterium]